MQLVVLKGREEGRKINENKDANGMEGDRCGENKRNVHERRDSEGGGGSGW